MLTLSNMVTGVIAFVFSIILSRELGAEGLGLYGLVMPIYGLLLTITSEGLITAISKITTLYFNRKDYRNLIRTLSTVFVFTACWAACVAILVLAAHRLMAWYIVRDPRSAQALMILCPALVFVPLSAIIKGYLYGLGKYRVSASVDIVEKLLRVVILLSTISILKPASVGTTVAVAYFALTMGELVSMLLLFGCYRYQRRKTAGESTGRSKSRIQLIFDVFVITVPLSINGILSSVLSAVSALILPRRLVVAGFSYSQALSEIGKFGGMALNIVTLPFIIIGSMLTVLVPELSLNISKKDYWSAEERIAQVLKMAITVGIATALVCLRIPDTLGVLFYRRNDLGDMIRFSAPICLILFVSSPTFGILNALGKQNILLKNSLINSLQSLVLTYVLAGIPALNIYGYGISAVITAITSFILNVREILKICEIKIGLNDILTYLLAGTAVWLASGIAGGVLRSAQPVITTAGVVLVCFIGMFGLNGLAFKFRTES